MLVCVCTCMRLRVHCLCVIEPVFVFLLSLSLAHSCNINQARRRWREEEEGREGAALLTIKGPRSTPRPPPDSIGRPGGLYGRHRARAPTQEKSQARQVDQPLHIEPYPHQLLLSLQFTSVIVLLLLCRMRNMPSRATDR